MNVWAVLFVSEDGDKHVRVYQSAMEAGMEAASWLAGNDDNPDGYIPDMVNAANDGDSSEFISNDHIWSVRIFKDSIVPSKVES